MSYSWIVRYDSNPHGTSWPHGERSICVENDFKIARSDMLFELKYCAVAASYTCKLYFKEVYEKWVKRHQKCINYAGEYFEKE